MTTRISTTPISDFIATDFGNLAFLVLGAYLVHPDYPEVSLPYADLYEDIRDLSPEQFIAKINAHFSTIASDRYGLDVTNGAPLVFSVDTEGYLCQDIATDWNLLAYYTAYDYLAVLSNTVDILGTLGVSTKTDTYPLQCWGTSVVEFDVTMPNIGGYASIDLKRNGALVGGINVPNDEKTPSEFFEALKQGMLSAFASENIAVSYSVSTIADVEAAKFNISFKSAGYCYFVSAVMINESTGGTKGVISIHPQHHLTELQIVSESDARFSGFATWISGKLPASIRLRNTSFTGNHRVELIPFPVDSKYGITYRGQEVMLMHDLEPGFGVCLSPIPCDCVSDTATRPIESPLAPDSVVIFEADCNGLFFSSTGSNNNDPTALVASLLAAAVTHNAGTQIYLSNFVDIIRDTANNQYIVKNKTSECLHGLNMRMLVWDHTGNNILGNEFFTPGLADFTSLCPKYPDIVCAGASDTVQFQTTLEVGEIKISVNDSPYHTANDEALSSLGISVSHYPMSLPGATCKIQVVGTGDKRLRIRVPDKYAALYANPDQGISQFDSNKAYAIFDANGSIIDPSHHSTDKSSNGSSFDDPSTPNDYYVWFNRMDVCLTKAADYTADYTADDMVMITSDQVDTVTLNIPKGTSDVHWGDGNVDLGVSGELTHTYETRGNYTVVVRKASNEGGTNGNNTMVLVAAFGIQEVVQWWSQGYEVLGFNLSMQLLQDTLTKVPTTAPLVFSNRCQIFMRCSVFNDPSVIGWDMSQYEDLNHLFYEAHAFNQPIGNWNVSNVTNMESLFFNAHAFNQDISAWNVAKVEDMDGMFYGCAVFDQDLSQWCVGLIASEPGSFRYGSVLTNAHCPVWGTCPRGENNAPLPVACNWRSEDAGISTLVANWGGVMDQNCAGVQTDFDPNTGLPTQQNVLDLIDRLNSAKAHVYLNRDATGNTYNNTTFAGTIDMSGYIAGLRNWVVTNYSDYSDNLGYTGWKPVPLHSPVANLPADMQAVVSQLDTLLADGCISETVDVWFEINTYTNTIADGSKVTFSTFTVTLRTYSSQRSTRVAYIDTVLESCIATNSTHKGYVGYSVNINGKVAITAQEYVALAKPENIITLGTNAVSCLALTNGGFMRDVIRW